MSILQRRTDPNPEKEMPFVDHLEELRWHILRSIFYICFFSCAAWYYYDPLYDLLSTPLIRAFQNAGYEPHAVFLDILEPLLFKLQVVLAASVVLALPFILWEIWRFVAPGLYHDERVFVQPLLPFSIVLCFLGFALIYYALPIAFEFLLKFAPAPNATGPQNAQLMQHLQKYFFFLLRMMIGAGVVFQTPIVLLLLGQLEIVSAAGLLRYWRHAVLVCFTVAAIITPTIDPFNMSIIAVPLVGLYFLSVVLVKGVEIKRARRAKKEAEQPADPTPEPPAEPAPNAPEPPPVPPAPAPAPAPVEATPAVVDRSALGPLAVAPVTVAEDEATFDPYAETYPEPSADESPATDVSPASEAPGDGAAEPQAP